ncbi:MAG: D-arabinono-1,4-lactone oxidase [Acidobacteriota bacterium]
MNAASNSEHSNWANTIELLISPGDNFFDPTTISGLESALGAALTDDKPNGKTLRILNSGHAWSPGIVPGPDQYPLPTASVPVPTMTVTDGILIDVTGLNPDNAGQDSYLEPVIVTAADSNVYAGVPAGMTQGELAYFAQARSFALKSMGPAPQITLGGFIANGCHGTGWSQPTVSDFVFGIEIMGFQPKADAPGEYEVTPQAFAVNQDVADAMGGHTLAPVQVSAETMSALRVSLGALGVITKIFIQLESLPMVKALDEIGYVFTDGGVAGVFDSEENLRTLVESCEYTEIFWFPFNQAWDTTTQNGVTVYGNELWVKRFNPAPGASEQNTELVTDLIRDTSDLAKWFGGLLAWIMDHLGALTPLINYGSFRALKGFMKNRQMASLTFDEDWNENDAIVDITTAYLYQLEYFTEISDLSWAIPIPSNNGQADFSNALTAWNELMKAIDDYAKPLFDKKYPNNLTAHLRFIKNSDSLLSPANQADANTHTCFIEFLSFTNDLALYREFTQKVVAAWYAIGGLPHFAKAFQYAEIYPEIQSRLAERGRLSDFQNYREQFDPGKFFDNFFLDGVLGAPSASDAVADTFAARGPVARETPDPSVVAQRSFAVGDQAAWNKILAASDTAAAAPATNPFLLHQAAPSSAMLIDQQGDFHLLKYHYDSASGRVNYQLLNKSASVAPRQVMLLIRQQLSRLAAGTRS